MFIAAFCDHTTSKLASFERQVERIALAVVDLACKPGAPGQHFCDTDEFGGQIDPADPHAVMRGEKPRRPAKPAADIEHPLAPAEIEHLGEPDRRRPLPAVKLIDRRQIVRGQMVDVLAHPLQRRQDRRPERAAGVMVFDRVEVIRHLSVASDKSVKHAAPSLALA